MTVSREELRMHAFDGRYYQRISLLDELNQKSDWVEKMLHLYREDVVLEVIEENQPLIDWYCERILKSIAEYNFQVSSQMEPFLEEQLGYKIRVPVVNLQEEDEAMYANDHFKGEIHKEVEAEFKKFLGDILRGYLKTLFAAKHLKPIDAGGEPRDK